ncbi:hypothetical protein GYMLUDRAFT_49702 [Collybiopsis luxurians FD-317 M1]|uniref:Uncharacterized protein n=1 Tax=Collybiopsis luxurians FD-317 M1 TaxID=944289 RepID=A0A0D0BE22_9AGAR|nr:hypothetical protein GYMLUDRAFT_49702 [Collybiopsis luxurians FD-317 M1]
MVSKHIVSHHNPVWGAYKPLSAFAVRILEGRPDVHFTVLIQGGMIYKKFMRELDKMPYAQLDEIRPRFHIIDLTGKDVNSDDPLPEFGAAFEALHHSKSVTCKSSGIAIEGLVSPTLAIIDVKSRSNLYL